MTPDINTLNDEVDKLQRALVQATQRRNAASAIYASALAQRPAGIPETWLPDFTISASTAKVNAWFDPAFHGRSIT